MGCGAAMTWLTTGLVEAALVTWEKNSCQVWSFLALGPVLPSSFRVLLVPYHATSITPGALPAATHGKTFTLAGGLLI